MDCEVIIKVPRKLNPIFRRKQGFRFDMYCWLSYIEYNEIINEGKDEKDDELFIRNVMLFAAESYNKCHGIKRLINNKIVQYWIDNTYQKDLQPIIVVMMKSKMGGSTIREYAEIYINNEKKKKAQ